MAFSPVQIRTASDAPLAGHRSGRSALARRLALSLGLALASSASALAQEGEPGTVNPATASTQLRTIRVTGTGEARARPDQATASFTVLRSADTARNALDAANAAMAKVTAGLREGGAEDRDLQTSGFSISPQYRYDQNQTDGAQKPPEIVGYEVRNTLTVTIRDVARVGEILDKAVSLGVNQGGEISFGLSDPKKIRDEARRDAVADARATASLYADAAGVALGPVRDITGAGLTIPPPVPMVRSMKMMAADAAPSVPVEAGENTYTTSVTMVFDITG